MRTFPYALEIMTFHHVHPDSTHFDHGLKVTIIYHKHAARDPTSTNLL